MHIPVLSRLLRASCVAATLIAGFCVVILPAYAAVATDTLSAYWKFDETSGTSATDASGEGNTGTNSGATISTDVPTTTYTNARSLLFDGGNDTVTATSSTSLNIGSSNFTIMAWVKGNTMTASDIILGKSNGGAASSGYGYLFGVFGGSLLPSVYWATSATGLTSVQSNVGIANGAWTHVAIVVDRATSANCQVYINGSAVSTTVSNLATNTGNITNSVDLHFGSESDGGFNWDGYIDDSRMYKRALSAREIAEIAAGNHPTQYWKGTVDTSFEVTGNWSGSYLPDPYTRVVIQSRLNQPSMTGAVSLAGLTINTGALLNINGKNLTFNDSGLFTNYGTLIIKGVETLTNFMNDSTKGTVLVYGTGSYTGLPSGTAYYNLTLNDGLIGYWKFDEASGSRVVDSAGYTNSGALSNGAAFSTAVPTVNFSNPRSVSLDGVNDYVSLSDTSTLQPNSISVGAWFKTTSAGHQIIFRKRWNGYSLRLLGGQVIGSIWESNISSFDVASPLTYNDGHWHHAMMTYNGTVVNLYVDGVPVASQVGAGTRRIYYEPGGISIGRDGDDDSGFFSGNIDDVRVYNRALKPAEIMTLFIGNEPSTGLGTVTLNGTTTVNGTLTLNGGTLDVSASQYGLIIGKSWLNNGGKFLSRSSNVTFSGTTSGLEILSGGQQFAKITLNGTGGTWNARDRVTASGTTVLSAGTLDNTDNYTLHFGQFVQNGGSITPGNGTFVLTGNANLTHTFTSNIATLRLEDPTENGLVAYWKFDEGTNSGSILDSSGYKNTGVRRGSGAVIWSGTTLPSLNFDNPFGMKFNGMGDRITASVTGGIPANPTNLTQAMWVKTTMTTGSLTTLVTRRNQGASSFSDWPTIFMANGAVTFAVDDNSYMNTTSYIPINDGAWHHVAGVKSGTTYSLYIDGILRDSMTDAHSMGGASGLPYNIGFAPNWTGSYFDGYMDDVRVYDRALSVNEIMNLARGQYAAGNNGTATFTLGNNLSANRLYLDSGNLTTNTYNLTDAYPLSLYRGNGTLTLGSGLTTLGGLIMSGSTVTAGSGDMDVDWDIQIQTGSLVAPTGTLHVSGNWLKTGGTFNANGGTVILDGTNQTINGTTTFHHLSKLVASADTLYFGDGETVTIDGVLTLQGAADNLLSIHSDTSGQEWFIDPSGTRTLSYLDVKDSHNINATAIDCLNAHCVNHGGNVNWLLPDPPVDAPVSATESTSRTTSVGGSRGHGTTLQNAVNVRTAMINRFTQQIALNKPEVIKARMKQSSSSSSKGTTEKKNSAPIIAEDSGNLFVATDDEQVVYKDVAVTAWYAPYVSQVITDGIAQGYKSSDGKLTGEFGVANSITYAEMLKMILMATKADLTAEPPRNLSAKGTWASPYVGAAEKLQLSVFKTDLDVHKPASRGEVIETLLEAFRIPAGNTPGEYLDLPKNHPHANAIGTATFYGLISGDAGSAGPTGTIRPDDDINRAEVSKIIALAVALIK